MSSSKVVRDRLSAETVLRDGTVFGVFPQRCHDRLSYKTTENDDATFQSDCDHCHKNVSFFHNAAVTCGLLVCFNIR